MTLFEVSTVLLAIGIIALVLQFLYAAVQVLFSTAPTAGWINAVLAVIAATTLAAVLVIDAFATPLTPAPVVIVALAAGAGLILGSILLILERRKDNYSAQKSPSVLLMAIFVLLGALTMFIPILPEQFWPAQEMLPTATLTTVAVASGPSPSPQPTVTPTALPTATPTSTQQPTLWPSATPTRERYSTRTPTPTQPVIRFCGAVVEYNLNLRRDRSLESEILLVIPFGSIVDVGGRSANGEWWFIEYNDEWGWVMGDYITPESLCENAPALE